MRRLFVLAALILALATPSFAGIALVTTATCFNNNTASSCTTGEANTTGANTLVAIAGGYDASVKTGASVTDSLGNTWVSKNEYAQSARNICIWIAENATVGAAQTFTLMPAATTYMGLSVLAYSGAKLSGVFDQQNGATNGASVNQDPGSVTPGENNEVIVTGMIFPAGTFDSIDDGFTRRAESGGLVAVAGADKVQTTAGAENPRWHLVSAETASLAIVTLKAQASVTHRALMLMGIGE